MSDQPPVVEPRSAPATGLAIPIRLPPALAAVRRRWDRAALAGAGPHVTVLYPFLPASSLDKGVREALAGIAAAERPFEVRFERPRLFEGELVWVEPLDPAPFVRLTTAVARRWPARPPYGGLFESPIVHATVVESSTAPLPAVLETVRRALPFESSARRLELWRQDEAGRWWPHWRLPLGGPVRP